MKTTKKRKKKLIVDLFAGGGGASLGIKRALGRSPDIAINHDLKAITAHALNHPKTKHLNEDIWKQDPRDLVGDDAEVWALWASPDCRHFSRAKGSKPVSKKVRSLAWAVIRWALRVKPKVIFLENVREFEEWGPTLPLWRCRACRWKGTEGQTRLARKRRRCPRCDSLRLIETADQIPDPKKKGLTFRKFCGRLRGLGYEVKHKTFDAAEYGAATHRKRLFLVARCDGKPIEWPEPSHGDPDTIDQKDLFSCDRLPWGVAADHIDFTLPCHSIFLDKEEGRAVNVKRPLAEKTMRRIALGVWRFVINNPKPFIVGVGGRAGQSPPTAVDQPVGTVTTKNDRAVGSPVLVRVGHGEGSWDNTSRDVNRPMATVTSSEDMGLATPFLSRLGQHGGNGSYANNVQDPLTTVTTKAEHMVVAPSLVQMGYGERQGQTPRALDVNEPLGTIVAGGGKHALVGALLTKYHHSKSAGDDRCGMPDEPIRTIDTENRHGVVAASLVGCGGAVYAGKPREVDRPLGTIMTGNRIALTGANLVVFRHDKDGRPVDEPLPTITAGGGPGRGGGAGHALGLAATSLTQFNGCSIGQPPDEPIGTMMAENHHGLASANIVRFNHGDKQWDSVDAPLATVTSQGNKFGLVYAFLMKYHGTAIGAAAKKPLPTVTSKDRFAVVQVEVTPGSIENAIAVNVPAHGWCVIADIGLRMLMPFELAGCQGFGRDYQLPGSKKTKVRLIGNSVPPDMVEAIVRANIGNPKYATA